MGGPIIEEREGEFTNSVPKCEWFWTQKGR